MPIYYLNLPARVDRRIFMDEQFARLGLRATRIEALTPDRIAADELERYCEPRRGGTLSPSALACRLGHLSVAQALIASGEPYAAVFEDDAVISSRFKSFLDAFAASAGKPDLLRLETHLEGLRLGRVESVLEGVEIAKPYSWEPGAAGYIMSRRAAEAFVANPRMRRRNDQALFSPEGWLARHVVLRQAIPALCIQSFLVKDGHQPRLGSDNRGPAPARFTQTRWQAVGGEIRRVVERDLVGGARKLFFRLRGVRKRRIDFAAD